MPANPYPQLYRLFAGNGTLATDAILPVPDGSLYVPIVTLLGDFGLGNTSERTGKRRSHERQILMNLLFLGPVTATYSELR